MTLLTTEQQQQVSQAIAEVEKNTDAELVAVLAKQSDRYQYIPLLWASLLALLTPGILLLSPLWLSTREIFWTQVIVFVVITVLFSWSPIAVRLIPKSVRYWRASNLAKRQFLENNLHHTKGETGVLVFVSEAERYIEIIADRGINAKIPHETWQSIVNTFALAVRQRRTLEGFLECIKSCGELLQEHVPATEEKNELPNHLIVLNY